MTVYTTIEAMRERVAALTCSGQPVAAREYLETALCMLEQFLTPALDAGEAETIMAEKDRAVASIRVMRADVQPWEGL